MSLLENEPDCLDRIKDSKVSQVGKAIHECAAYNDKSFRTMHCFKLRKLLNDHLESDEEVIPLPKTRRKHKGKVKVKKGVWGMPDKGMLKEWGSVNGDHHWLDTFKLNALSSITCTPLALITDKSPSLFVVEPSHHNNNCKTAHNNFKAKDMGKVTIFYNGVDHFRPTRHLSVNEIIVMD